MGRPPPHFPRTDKEQCTHWHLDLLQRQQLLGFRPALPLASASPYLQLSQQNSCLPKRRSRAWGRNRAGTSSLWELGKHLFRPHERRQPHYKVLSFCFNLAHYIHKRSLQKVINGAQSFQVGNRPCLMPTTPLHVSKVQGGGPCQGPNIISSSLVTGFGLFASPWFFWLCPWKLRVGTTENRKAHSDTGNTKGYWTVGHTNP